MRLLKKYSKRRFSRIGTRMSADNSNDKSAVIRVKSAVIRVKKGFLRGIKNRDRAVTLVEVVLALALGALILTSLTRVFKTGWQGWKEANERSELIQHARVAMWRITDDLRYAQGLDELPTSGSSGNLQFTTQNLLSGSGVIRYEILNSELRRIEEGTMSTIAGSSSEGINVTTLDITPLKVVEIDGKDNLVALDAGAGDVASETIAVKVDLTLQDTNENTFTLSSTAKLRNREL